MLRVATQIISPVLAATYLVLATQLWFSRESRG
jgi:hypothetical protein